MIPMTRPIFRARKYFVMVKQTDTGALFSGHWSLTSHFMAKTKIFVGGFLSF